MRFFFVLICLQFSVHAATWDEINQSLLKENWSIADLQLEELIQKEKDISQKEYFNALLNHSWVKYKLGLTDEAKSTLEKAKSLSYQADELESLTLDDTALMIKYQHVASFAEIEQPLIIDSQPATSFFNNYFKTAQSASVWTSGKIAAYLDLNHQPTPFIKPIPPKLLRGEFEKTDQFITRVEQAQSQYKQVVEKLHQNELAKNQALADQQRLKEQYLPTIRRLYIQAALKIIIGNPRFELHPYNAEEELFTATIKPEIASNFFEGLTVEINEPIESAPALKQKLMQANPVLIFNYSNKGLKLAQTLVELPDQILRNLTVSGKTQKQHFTSYQIPEIKYQQTVSRDSVTLNRTLRSSSEVMLKSIDPEIKRLKNAMSNAILSNNNQDIIRLKKDITLFEARLQQSFNDDLEGLLKQVNPIPENPNHYALIVGINQYAKTLNVEFADRSAKLFSKVAQSVLGVPEANIIALYNEEATGSTIKTRLKHVGQNLKAGDTLYFYYAGHGIPAQQEHGDPYLLAHDMSVGYATLDKDMRLSNVWDLLTNTKQGKVIAFLDSCFSGNSDNRFIFEGVAPGLLKRKSFSQKLAENLLIFTAGNEAQFANYYPEKGHRLFSYFLARGLMQGIKQPEQLHQYLLKNVEQLSQRLGPDYKQSPQMSGHVNEAF